MLILLFFGIFTIVIKIKYIPIILLSITQTTDDFQQQLYLIEYP